MKKVLGLITIFFCVFMIALSMKVYAVSLDTINISTDKHTVHPGETVKVNIDFGTDLGSYTVDVAYDKQLLEYVSAEGGLANDTGTKVRVFFVDSNGGATPRKNMSVTFKAKDEILTSNPTEFSITAEGLAGSSPSNSYDDITIPIIKDIIVEPNFIDYDIALNYTGDVIVNEEKNMEIVISSKMGKNYEHTRIIAEVVTPNGENVKLLAKDSQNLEHDIIESGWGSAKGDPLGGKDVLKKLSARGVFTGKGDYTITLKIINRDNSDSEIASKTFKVNVKEKTQQNTPNTNTNTTTPPATGETDNGKIENNSINNVTTNNSKPTSLPKTGNMIYLAILPVILILGITYIALRKKD